MPVPPAPNPLRVTLDATPLLGLRTGIGRYVEHLVAGLAGDPTVALTATAFTLRGAAGLAAALPPGVRHRTRPVPARLLRRCWMRTDLPPVEWLSGRTEVFHGTNYVLPPVRRAVGVLSVHDLSYLQLPDTVHQDSLAYRTLVPRGLRRAAAVCALTAVSADEIAEAYGYPRDRITVTGLGVEPAWFDARPPGPEVRDRFALPADYLVFVGTREPRKGLSTLLAAHARLTAQDPQTPPLVLVGAGGWGADLAAQPGVMVLPYVDQIDLPSIVAGAAGLVMPSVYEGFGLPALEGMAAGTPVVISQVPAMVEVAAGHAVEFPVGDVEALAEALRTVLTGRGPDRLAAAAHARGFTWPHCTRQVLSAYRSAVG